MIMFRILNLKFGYYLGFRVLILGFMAACLGFVAFVPNAHAALIIQAPKYIGLTNGLVGYWSFDGKDVAGVTALDRSGNNNNGTLTGGPTRAIGKIGQGLSFDGFNDYVNTGIANLPSTNAPKTFSLWVYRRSSTSGVPLSIGGNSCNVEYFRGNGTLYKCGDSPIVSPNIFVSNNVWTHIVYTFDGTTNKLYLNGALNGSSVTAHDAGAITNSNIGRRSIGSTYEFDGEIDDVRVYNRALTGDEIKRLYRIGATLKINTSINNDSLKNGLVGYWSFDGKDVAGVTALDRSGNNNNGTLTGGPTRAIGKIGQGLSFDGVDDVVSVTQSASINDLDTVTVSAWVYARSSGGGGCGRIVDKVNASADGGFQFHICGSPATSYMEFDAPRWQTTNGAWITANDTLGFNGWHHVAVTYDYSSTANDPKLYLDGTFIASSEFATPAGTKATGETETLNIGNRNNLQRTWNGLIDDVRVYNRALTGDEIKRLYRIGATLKINTSINNDSLKNGLVGYWSFDGKDVAGVTAYDRSGQNNNGTLTNGPTRAIGKIGQGLSFDGTNDYVTMGTPSTLKPIIVSVTGWIRVTGPANGDGAPNNSSGIFNFTKNADPWWAYGLQADGTNGTPNYQVYTFHVATGGVKTELTATLSSSYLNQWHFVAGTYDGAVMNIYIDGEYMNSTPKSGDIDYTSAYLASIGSWGGTDEFANGQIDDVRVYNRALSADEIKRLYKIGAALKINTSINNDSLKNGLVGYWTMNGPDMVATSTGSAVIDRSGNNNTGYLQNGPVRAIGKIGQGLSFDGVNDEVTMGDVTLLELNLPFSVSLWVKPTNGPDATQYFIVSKWLSTGNQREWEVGMAGTTHKLRFQKSSDGGNVNLTSIDSNSVPSQGVWTHGVVTVDVSGNWVWYFNGTNNGSGTIANTTIFHGTANFIFGSVTTGGFYPGGLDDVRVYNRVLTGNEIKRLYNLGR
ncbi:MAG: LamG domain-containing protein [bacterium]|nr:LamG domain-containing protein [bacterium]